MKAGDEDWKKRLRDLGLARPRARRVPAAGKTAQQLSGESGEELAAVFLTGEGARILARNARYGCGEIDIVAEDAGVLAFVEVKKRQNARFGDPAEAVTVAKQQRIRSAARLWMRENPGSFSDGVRFDVISIEVETHRIEWLKGAFDGHA
jgi:putative endonuclease